MELRHLFIALILLVAHSSLSAGDSHDGHDGKKNITALRKKLLGNATTQYYQVSLDHFNWRHNESFYVRYLIDDTHWGGLGYPMLLYTGGEGPIESFFVTSKFVTKTIAERFKALLLFIEHRQFGASWPEIGFASLGYLMPEQALEDFAGLAQCVAEQLPTGMDRQRALPTIAVGSSYSGMLSAWMRSKYPSVVDMAVSSSAPVIQGQHRRGFSRVVTDDLQQAGCALEVKKVFHLLALTYAHPSTYLPHLKRSLDLCPPSHPPRRPNATEDVLGITVWLVSSMDTIAQYDIPYRLGSLAAHPLKHFCAELRANRTAFAFELPVPTADTKTQLRGGRVPVDTYESVFRSVKGALNSTLSLTDRPGACLPLENNLTSEGLPLGDRVSWNYLCCTVFGDSCTDEIFFTDGFDFASVKTDRWAEEEWRAPGVLPNLEQLIGREERANCEAMYGVKPDDRWVARYTGYRYDTCDKVVFTNGLVDPLSGESILEAPSKTCPVLNIAGGAHALDLGFIRDDDPPSLKRARRQVIKQLDEWLTGMGRGEEQEQNTNATAANLTAKAMVERILHQCGTDSPSFKMTRAKLLKTDLDLPDVGEAGGSMSVAGVIWQVIFYLVLIAIGMAIGAYYSAPLRRCVRWRPGCPRTQPMEVVLGPAAFTNGTRVPGSRAAPLLSDDFMELHQMGPRESHADEDEDHPQEDNSTNHHYHNDRPAQQLLRPAKNDERERQRERERERERGREREREREKERGRQRGKKGADEVELQPIVEQDRKPRRLRVALTPPLKMAGEGAFTSINQFHILKQLHRSPTGAVYLARARSSGQGKVVLKHRTAPELGNSGDFLNEYRLLKGFSHPNIIKCYGYFYGHDGSASAGQQRGGLYVVLEYADRGDLATEIHRRKQRNCPFSHGEVWDTFMQVLSGVKYLHKQACVHRDLKPLNVFLTSDGLVKVGDLGVGRRLSDETLMLQSFYGTPRYLSPEMIQGRPYTASTDMWSLGVVLYELLTLNPPFRGQSLQAVTNEIILGRWAPLPPECADTLFDSTIRGLLQSDPDRRPTADVLFRRLSDTLMKTRRQASADPYVSRSKPSPPLAEIDDKPAADASPKCRDQAVQCKPTDIANRDDMCTPLETLERPAIIPLSPPRSPTAAGCPSLRSPTSHHNSPLLSAESPCSPCSPLPARPSADAAGGLKVIRVRRKQDRGEMRVTNGDETVRDVCRGC
ncbi:unnamed protein product [Vitrella brassicaformis CCMP3155]|uniref:non-specific serine/threonine protein kinase n=4 Tax=Vitrella brassicaformis TaxID=1169539 RepID=A0A0G4EI32_VITBC|nr:unnamed protein product [Vitrella brassicaformis CCMP3155]|eukprot:CEL95631.1 unnamed protein product [Vitrella brassicaformis CCMP3155]